MQIPKGTKDIMPEDKIIRNKVVSLLAEIFETYGFNPLETPALEMYETLASKYAGGAEIMKEVYTLEDNAKRKMGLRYDLTVPFARVIAMNPELRRPFKRYQIDKVWRDGPIKLGRYREFWQCDADVVGIKSLAAEAELLTLASDFFSKMELDVEINVNNRKLMNSILEYCGVDGEKQETVILSIDKLKKIGVDGVRKELEGKEVEEESIVKVLSIFNLTGENKEILVELERILGNNSGIDELRQLFGYLEKFDVKEIKLDVTLARGLSYYTGTVFEVYLKGSEITSSVAAGGRYDKMIGNFLETKEEIPAVGISFGLDVLADALKIMQKDKMKKSVIDVFFIPIKVLDYCMPLLAEFRREGIKADIDYNNKSLLKNLDYANKLGVSFVVIAGDEEKEIKKIKLKNMIDGSEKMVSVNEAIKIVKNFRK